MKIEQRVAREVAALHEGTGIGFFADPGLTPAEKGVGIDAPVGAARVVSIAGDAITLDGAIAAAAGDVVLLGEAAPAAFVDGADALELAGLSGATYARRLVDAAGDVGAPHHRAVDMTSDNRVPGFGAQASQHVFPKPTGCPSIDVSATLLYRPVPVDLGRERGVPAKDYVVAAVTRSLTLP